jgi:hypothetical protein
MLKTKVEEFDNNITILGGDNNVRGFRDFALTLLTSMAWWLKL